MGAPQWKIEITADQLEDCVEDAKRWFSAKKGVKKQAVLCVNAGQVEYLLPDDVDTVLDVAFPVAPLDLSYIYAPFMLLDEKVPYDVFAAPNSAGLYSTFTQTLQYVEMAKRVLGADPDWRQEGRKLMLFPKPRSAGAVILDFKSNIMTVDQLNERDHDLVKRFALARAREIVGGVRSKYGEFVGAQGNRSADGERQLETAEKEFEKLEEEISLSGFPIGFMVG